MRIPIFFLLFSLLPLLGFSTTITCSDVGYAGKQLTFLKPSDPISGETELCFKLNFDSSGNAAAEINTPHTIYTFCDFSVYRGMLYLEPGKTIQLKLPPFREKSFANQKNPYFTPVQFWFISENQNELTDKVSSFEQKLNLLTDKHFDELYFKQSKTIWDSVVMQLNTAFPETLHETLNQHKNLKTKFIEADVFRLRPEDYSIIFSDIHPEFWMHQAFIALFDKTFDRQLSFSAKAIKGKEINTAVKNENTSALLNFVKTKYKVSGKMAELVLLKLLHDGFYSGEFSRQTIKNMVTSDIFLKNSNPLIKRTAQNIGAKFTFLQKGSPAPVICLSTLNGQQECTNSHTDKFKYIIFADAETAVCREHLKYLSRINELFAKNLEIYVILRNTNKKGTEDFLEENKVPGVKMIDIDAKYSSLYKIRSYPQCFLFDEKHQVIFADTKPPLDGFEQQFGTWLRNELFMRQRNQSR